MSFGVTYNLPFNINIKLPLEHNAYHLKLYLKGAKPGKNLEDTEEIITYLFNAANAGAFCMEGISPINSKLEVTPQVNRIKDHELQYQLFAENLNPGIWRILVNMLAQTHYKLDELSELNLTSDSIVFQGLSDLLKTPFPSRYSDLPFSLDIDDNLYQQTELSILFEFDKEVKEDLLEEITERLNDLSGIIYLGGFYNSFKELEYPQLYDSETYCPSPNSILHYIRDWNADFISLECFINVAIKFHSALCPDFSLEIE